MSPLRLQMLLTEAVVGSVLGCATGSDAAQEYEAAATADGAEKFGEPLDVAAKVQVDLFVIGSAAVNPSSGCRAGSLSGVEDLHYEILRQTGAIDERTPEDGRPASGCWAGSALRAGGGPSERNARQ